MKIKVSEATNNQLDYLAAKVLNLPIEDGVVHTGEFYWDEEGLQWEVEWSPTTSGAQVVPIIESEHITVGPYHGKGGAPTGVFQAYIGWDAFEMEPLFQCDGPTPLIAAMRCFVASKLGDEVEVPSEMLT